MIWGVIIAIVLGIGYCLYVYRRDATVNIPDIEMCKKLKNPQSWTAKDMEDCASYLVYMGITESKYEDTLNLGLYSQYQNFFKSRGIRYKFEYQAIRLALFTWYFLPTLKISQPGFEKMKQLIIEDIMKNTPAPDNKVFKNALLEYWDIFTQDLGKADTKLVVSNVFCAKLGIGPAHEISQKLISLIVPNLVDCILIQIKKMQNC